MKTEHRYAQALRWIADGKNLQIRWGKDPRWMELPERNEIVMDEILRGVGAYEFRIKPRTVKIGNREIEAPVLEPEEGQELWYCATCPRTGERYTASLMFTHDSPTCVGLQSARQLYLSGEAATTARDAWVALVDGSTA